MRRVLCRAGWHSWRPPSQWITFNDGSGGKVVRGIQRCRRRDCRAVRVIIGYVLARAVDAGRQLGQPGELVRRITGDDTP